MAGISDDFDVFVQCPLINLEWGGFPFFSASFQLFGGHLKLDTVLHCVDRNYVTVFDEGNRAANLCLWHDMPDAEAVRPIIKLASVHGVG